MSLVNLTINGKNVSVEKGDDNKWRVTDFDID